MPHRPHSFLSRLTTFRGSPDAQHGKLYWRSLQELADTTEFRDFLRQEFPSWQPHDDDALSRRNFLRLMGASLGLAGLTACATPPRERIHPYTRAPEYLVPGRPLYFATSYSLAGSSIGLLVRSDEGRPTKIEGNPSHPASLGATDARTQASLLDLYDPDRSQALTWMEQIRPWSVLFEEIRSLLAAQRPRGGAGLRLLTETVLSPTLGMQIQSLLGQFPGARWHQYEPLHRDAARNGATLTFGRDVNTIYRLRDAAVILSLDSDFLTLGLDSVRHAREFSHQRAPQQPGQSMSRFYAVECAHSATGAKADHRLAIRAGEVETFARMLAAAVRGETVSPDARPYARWLQAAARDLVQHRGRSVVIPGEGQPASVHAWAHIINHALGAFGSLVVHTEPVEFQPVVQQDSLRELTEAMDAGVVEWLLILGGNPAYNAPADFRFAERLQSVPARMHLAPYPDETSALCQWHVPEAHYLEAWSDTRTFNGSAAIVQPLIAPLWNGRSVHELLTALSEEPARSAHDLVRDTWRGGRGGADFESFWRQSLHDGVIEGTAFPALAVTPRTETLDGAPILSPPPADADLEVAFRPDPSVLDGRFANNGWLQELPKPLSRLTWENAALLSPTTAERLGFAASPAYTGGERGHAVVNLGRLELGSALRDALGDALADESQDMSLTVPVWIVPGQADGCVILHLGYGRSRAGRVGSGLGFNAYRFLTSRHPQFVPGAALHRTGERYSLAVVQMHHNIEGRDLIHSSTLDEFQERSAAADLHPGHPALSLYPDFRYEGYAWGMAIDLNACVGCNACVVACQAENNIPIVGKREVLRAREMHWLRIDTYHSGLPRNPRTFFQPVPCMHCENAPCEPVCPVNATVHSSEGLNDMVYNRCVGTRYCSNNCPYKVRRFNFFQYADWDTPSVSLGRNPDVTVRSRGVMEKCTYCVQRISRTRIEAQKANRRIEDGGVQTACQQVCPARAIVFGDVNDSRSLVAQRKAGPRNYALLAELNTRPRTTYAGAVTNPNPEISQLEESPDSGD